MYPHLRGDDDRKLVSNRRYTRQALNLANELARSVVGFGCPVTAPLAVVAVGSAVAAAYRAVTHGAQCTRYHADAGSVRAGAHSWLRIAPQPARAGNARDAAAHSARFRRTALLSGRDANPHDTAHYTDDHSTPHGSLLFRQWHPRPLKRLGLPRSHGIKAEILDSFMEQLMKIQLGVQM